MSEYISMFIEIGGDLPDSKVKELMGLVGDEFGEIYDGPSDEDTFRAKAKGKTTIRWSASANYGLCEDLEGFLCRNKIGYTHHCEGKYDYDADIRFWIPGMKEEVRLPSNQTGDKLIRLDTIRPVCDLLLAVIARGSAALPAFLNNERLANLVEKGLKNPKKLHDLLKKEVDRVLPALPELPPLRII